MILRKMSYIYIYMFCACYCLYSKYKNFVKVFLSQVCLLITVLKFYLLSFDSNYDDGSLRNGSRKCSRTVYRQHRTVCGRSPAKFVGSNPADGIEVCPSGRVVLSGISFCDCLITRPEEYYRMCCVWVRAGNLKNEEALTRFGATAPQKRNTNSAFGFMIR